MGRLRSASLTACVATCALMFGMVPLSYAGRTSTSSNSSTASARAAVIATERSLTPTSSGKSPMVKSLRSIHKSTFVPAWLAHSTISDGDRPRDGVALGPNSYFPALGNDDGIGDCTVVAVRDIAIASALRFGTSVGGATTAQAIAAWQHLNGATTNGLSDLEVLEAWSTSTGILGSRISGWETLNLDSLQRIKQAIVATGGVYASLNVPTTISWSKLVWSLPKHVSARITDHAIALIGWVTQGWIAVSWGELVMIPWSDWRAEAIGAYAVLPTSTE